MISYIFFHFSRLPEIISDVVNKYGIVWVVSGSNDGPALSTVGIPPALATSSLIGVSLKILLLKIVNHAFYNILKESVHMLVLK